MTWTHRLRQRVFQQLPPQWQPAAEFQYHRVRSLLDRELPQLVSRLRPDSSAVDVGANFGIYTHAFARSGVRVHAFEPQPACFRVLSAYAQRNARVRVYGVALGSATGRATLHVPTVDGAVAPGWASLRGGQENAVDVDVEVRTLDSFALGDVSVIKVDVEGHELEVLAGARDTLARCRPVLLVELEARHLDRPLTAAFRDVEALGYRGTFLSPAGTWRPVAEFSASDLQSPTNADTPRALYINNFLFEPR